MTARTRRYRMTGAFGAAPPKAKLIICDDGSLGYLRIEDANGEYVGSLEGRSLVALARTVLKKLGTR